MDYRKIATHNFFKMLRIMIKLLDYCNTNRERFRVLHIINDHLHTGKFEKLITFNTHRILAKRMYQYGVDIVRRKELYERNGLYED